RQVVIDELPEIGVRSGNTTFLIIFTVFRAIDGVDHRRCEPFEQRLALGIVRAEVSRRQRSEHAPEAALEERASRIHLETARWKSVWAKKRWMRDAAILGIHCPPPGHREWRCYGTTPPPSRRTSWSRNSNPS